MADYKIQGEASLDITKAEQGLTRLEQGVKNATQGIQRESKRASEAAEGIGDGINVGAQKFSRAESQISASIKRATTQLELLGKTASQKIEFRINERGLDASKFEPALRKLRELEEAQRRVNAETSKFAGLADGAAGAVGGFAAALASSFSVRQFIDAADAVTQLQNRLKLAAGGAVEAQNAYNGLFEIAQRSRVSFTELGSTFASISRSAKDYGVTQKELLRVTEAVANAVTISGSSAQASQAALTQLSQGLASGTLRGEELNSVMEQTPRLARAIADGLGVPIGKLREMGAAGEISAKQVIEALKSQSDVLAGEVNDSVVLVSQSFQQLSNSATNFVGVINEITGATSGLSGVLTRVTSVVDLFSDSLRKTFAGNELGDAADKVLELDRRSKQLRDGLANGFFRPEMKAELDDVNRRLEQAKRNFRELAAITSNGGIDPRDQSQFKSRGQSYKEEAERQAKLQADKDAFLLRNSGVNPGYVKDVQELIRLNQAGVLVGDEYTKALKRQQDQLYKGATGGGAKQTNRDLEDQAQLLSKLSGLSTSFYKDWELLNRAYATGKISLDALTEAQARLLADQPFSRDLAKETTEALKQQATAANELAKAEQDRINAAERSATGVQDQVQKLLDEERALTIAAASNISLAQAIEEVNIARLREQQAQLMAQGDRDAEVLAIQKEIDARKQLQQAIGRQEARDEAKKAADEAAREWQKTADAIEQTLTEALMRGFESGKGFGESLADSIVNTFKTYVAREIAKAISNAILSAIAGQNWAGLIGGVLGGNGGGGYGSLLSGANNASSLTSAYNTFANGAGSNYGAAASWATGGMSTANLAGSIYANAATSGMATGSIAASGAGIDALLATNAAYGTAASAGAAAGTAGAGAASAGAAGATSALAAIPVWGWVAIAAIALWQPLFGRKLKEVGTQINFREGDISTNDYKFEKGGWFRSDKTTMLGDTTDANKQLVQQAENIQESAKGMARALGFGTDAIDSFSGTVNVNMKGVKSNEEAAQRYNEALMELQRQMLNAATGANMSKEAFAEWINGINQSIADAGISTQGIADILVQGMMGRLSQQEVGDQLADMIVGGIYNSIASNYAAQIAQAFTAQIITPIFTALAAGVPISQAISQQAIANVVATAQQAAAAMNAIFSDPGFRSAISGIEQAIGGVSAAVTSVRIPKFGSARTAASNAPASNAAAQAANQEAQERYNLETKLLQLLGNTARLRERELAGLSASNRALQLRIWAIEDAQAAVDSATSALDGAKDAIDGAMSALERAVNKQKEKLQTQLDTALEAESALNDVFQTLRDNIKELRGEVDSTAGISAEDGRNRIQQAISGAIKLSNDELVDAIDAVRGGLENEVFGSQFERDRAFLRFASELETLAGVTEDGLSGAERQVMLLEEQIAALDAQAEISKQQVEALFGIDNSVKTVAQAVGSLNTAMAGYAQAVTAQNAAMAAYAQAVAAAQQVATSAGAAPSSSGGGGGYSGGGGGGYSAPKPKPKPKPKPATKASWTPQGYWDKNEDLRSYWTANGELLAKGRGWSRDDYLRWHWESQGQAEMRAYAKGGYYPGGLALVGEEGPELINFRNPGQVYTASQTAELLKAGGDKEVVKAIESLRADQRAQSASMVRMQSQLNKIFSRWDVDGVPEKRVTA